MKTPIWKPSEEVKKRANITRFISFVNKKYGLKIDFYDELRDLSIEKFRIPEQLCASLIQSKLLTSMIR